MKIRRSFIALAAVLTLSGVALASSAHAQEPGAAPGAPGGGGRRAGGQAGGQRRGGANPVQGAVRTLTLTDDQKTKIEDLTKKSREAAMAGGGQQTPQQRQETEQKLITDIEAVLTPEQKPQFETALTKERAKPLLSQLDDLSLTEDQKKKIEPIIIDTSAALTKLRNDTSLQGADRRTKTTAAIDDMKGKVRPLLTPDQQTKFDAIQWNQRRGGAGGRRPGGPGGPGAPGAPGGAPAPATP